MDAKLLTASVATLPVLGFVVGLSALAGSNSPTPTSASDVCATSGPVDGLPPAAAANGRVLVAVAEQAGGEPAAVIAVAVGLTESGLRVLGNADGQQGNLPVEGIGSDHDSIGIFQQRPSWGTAAQRLDPAASTSLFIERLLSDPGWQTKPPWVAAQDVQVSAYDGVPRAANDFTSTYGGNYAASVEQAESIVATITNLSGASSCGTLTGGVAAGPASRRGLAVGYTIPSDASATEATVVAFAIAQLDKPYVFGAAGPDAFDCSGLTAAAWGQVGVSLPHWTVAQAQAGTGVSKAAMSPGDLVLVPGDDGTLAAPGHVGMYIGDDLVINAADEKDGIRVQTFADFVRAGHGLFAIRHIG